MCAWLARAPRTRPWKAAVPQTAAEPASEQPPASSMSKHLPPSGRANSGPRGTVASGHHLVFAGPFYETHVSNRLFFPDRDEDC